MYSPCYLKNIDSINQIVLGVELTPDQEYQIPDNKRISASNDSNLLQLIADSKIDVGNGSSYLTTLSEKINRLKNIDEVEIDSQGRQIIRPAAGQKGWTYLARPIEFEISKLGSLYSKNYLDQDYGDVTIKFYNASNVEVTSVENESTIVKTVVLLKPNHDYELIAGNVRQVVAPTNDVRVWVIGGIIELGGAYVKEFAAGINLKYLGADEEIKTDGRAAKYMTKDIAGVPYQGNQLQIIVRHNAGDYHKIMLMFEYFRA